MSPISLALLSDAAALQFCTILALDVLFGFGICGD
jgi:hypothetical protein